MTIERTNPPASGSGEAAVRQPPRRAAWKLYLLIFVSVAPVVASYLAYYVFPPSDRTNYGMLIEPQRPVPALSSALVHAPERPGAHPPAAAAGAGSAAPGSGDAALAAALRTEGLGALKGKWILLAVDGGACERPCAEKLFFMRQTHASLGRERDRVQQVLLVTDRDPLPPPVLAAHPGLTVLQVAPEALGALLPVEATTALSDHLYLIDPLHNLMMRFPPKPDAGKTRRDLQKLLKASRIG